MKSEAVHEMLIYFIDLFIFPIAIMYGWNQVIPEISSLQTLTYWQSIVLTFTINLMLSGGCTGYELIKTKHEEIHTELRAIRNQLQCFKKLT